MHTDKRTKLRQCQSSACILRQVWEWISEVAHEAQQNEPALKHLLSDVCLIRHSLSEAMVARLSRKLSRRDMGREDLEPIVQEALEADPSIAESMARDLIAIVDRDPACHSPLEPLLFFKGFHAISTYRVAHWLWNQNRRLIALQLQSIASEVFSVDIHPAAQIGCGILLDHATSCVIGETAIVRDNVSILHEVTLGGTGKDEGNRHPIVESGVLIGAGAKILGRVTIGECAKIAACSVVLTDIPPHSTAAGVPAIVVGDSSDPTPALDMNQKLTLQ